MYILNRTFVVDEAAHALWLRLMQEQLVPRLRELGCNPRLSRVLSEQAEPHHTYSLMVEFEEMGNFQKISGDIMEEYHTLAGDLFGDGVVWFATVLKILE